MSKPTPPTQPVSSSLKEAQTDALSTRSIAGAAALVMLFFVLSRLTGLARDMVIAAQFDLSATLDAYQAAFRIPDLLFEVVAGGALGSAFIPTFAGFLARGEQAQGWLLFSRILNWVTLILLLLAGIAALFALPLVQWVIGPEFPPDQQQLTAELMRWLLVGTVVYGASGLIMGALNAFHHFLLPAAAPVIRNLAIILGAWLLAPRMGVYGLVVGAVVGSLGHLLVQIPGLYFFRFTYRPSLAWRDAGVQEVARLMGPRVLGLFFVHLNFIVNTALASGLAAGSLSALTYSWRLMLLPLGIFAQALGVAAFPTFAAQVAAGRPELMRASFGQILRTILFLTLPAAVGLIVLGEPLVQVLYQRGEFTVQSTRAVAYGLQFYAVGLVAHAAVEIIVRAFYALHDTLTPVVIGVGAMILNILLSLWWIRYWGYGGLALANSVATTLEMAGLLWVLRRSLGGLDLATLAPAFARSVLASLLMGGALWVSVGGVLAAQTDTAFSGLALVGWMAFAVLVYGGSHLLLGGGELRAMRQLVRRR